MEMSILEICILCHFFLKMVGILISFFSYCDKIPWQKQLKGERVHLVCRLREYSVHSLPDSRQQEEQPCWSAASTVSKQRMNGRWCLESSTTCPSDRLSLARPCLLQGSAAFPDSTTSWRRNVPTCEPVRHFTFKLHQLALFAY